MAFLLSSTLMAEMQLWSMVIHQTLPAGIHLLAPPTPLAKEGSGNPPYNPI